MTAANIHPGFRLILPYLRQIESLILDPNISEIMVNSPSDIFIEKQGVMERVPDVTIPIDQLRVAVQNIARSLGDDISEEKPILDSRLPDGSRIAAVLPPCSIHGITLTIRKFNTRSFKIEDLIRIGTITEEMATYLQAAISSRKNILISGGTGTGKTTLLNILADFIPDEDRLLVIEDTAEIHIRKPNLVRFGNILVTHALNAAWVPLLRCASGVVTHVGGMLSHAAVLAREFRVPAVLGAGAATASIQQNQFITVDGTQGKVFLTTK